MANSDLLKYTHCVSQESETTIEQMPEHTVEPNLCAMARRYSTLATSA
jgi:hypothetical protein